MQNHGRREPGESRSGGEQSAGMGRSDGTAHAGTTAEGDHLLLRFLAQLSRFGLAAGGDPLLKPARPSGR